MLSINSYSQEYVDRARAAISAQVAAYKKVATGAKQPALAEFEPLFFGNMVLALDSWFCHRARTLEGKDGNPLNEVRVLCNSIWNNQGALIADKSIKLKPEHSVLGYAVGDAIALSESDFLLLSDAFLAEIESKFVNT
jgi:hypothetical protein